MVHVGLLISPSAMRLCCSQSTKLYFCHLPSLESCIPCIQRGRRYLLPKSRRNSTAHISLSVGVGSFLPIEDLLKEERMRQDDVFTSLRMSLRRAIFLARKKTS